MDSKEFDEFLEMTFDHIRDMLASKGAEYVPGTAKISRFHNFQIGAGLNQQTIEQVLWGFVTKHIVSLSDMVKKPASESKLEAWDEKIGDVINYMILLKAMVTYDARVAKEIKGFLGEDEAREKQGFDLSGLSFTTDIPERRERDDEPPAAGGNIMDVSMHTDPVNTQTSVNPVVSKAAEEKSTTIDKRPAKSGADNGTVHIQLDGGLTPQQLAANQEHTEWIRKHTPPQYS